MKYSQQELATIKSAADNVARIAMDFPDKPTTAQVLEFLLRAEQAGYERAQAEIELTAESLLSQRPTCANHSPGPWAVIPGRHSVDVYSVPLSPINEEGKPAITGLVALVYGHYDSDYNYSLEANRRLIAAAPDLLGSLKDARVYLPGHPGCPPSLLARVDAAIAKAQDTQDDATSGHPTPWDDSPSERDTYLAGDRNEIPESAATADPAAVGDSCSSTGGSGFSICAVSERGRAAMPHLESRLLAAGVPWTRRRICHCDRLLSECVCHCGMLEETL